MKILITGATGNVGKATLQYLKTKDDLEVFRATQLSNTNQGELYFDFDNIPATGKSLNGIDVLFLLRPPNLSNTQKYFAPLIDECIKNKIKHIVFLSVQGADKSSIIPHHKIEKLIVKSGILYTFIRPSYFMQNLTTTLREDIVNDQRIFLPAGKAKFLWVDVNDIGAAIAQVLINFSSHKNQIYTITGSQLFSFMQVAELLTKNLKTVITYKSPSLLEFFLHKKKNGSKVAYIFVMMLLHYIARFEKEPMVSGDYTRLTKSNPNTLDNFIKENLALFKTKNI